MKSNSLTCLRSLVLALVLAFLTHAQSAPEATARKALDALLTSRYSDFETLLSTDAREKLTIEFLRTQVNSEINGFGKMQSIGKPVVVKSGNRNMVSFPVQFAKTTINIQFTLTEAGEIGGLYFRPADQPLPPLWQRPAYSKPESFTERTVTVGSDEWKLPGVFTVPLGKGPFPAVVLVHGPGPNDRDESIYATRIFADIAEGLASRGIASLRYDKRTRVYAPQMAAMSYTLKEETTDDAVRAVTLLRAQPEVDSTRVYLLGHSLGGYILPRIARQSGKIAGVVVLAGNARPIEDVSVSQTEFMLNSKGGPTADEAKRVELMKEEAARVHHLADGKETSPILLGLPVAYYLDLKSYDPISEMHRLGIPVLFLQGERDFQVTMADDFKLWKSGLGSDKNISFRTYASLNHLFISGDGPPNPMEYRKPGNVSPVVIDDLVDFISHSRHK